MCVCVCVCEGERKRERMTGHAAFVYAPVNLSHNVCGCLCVCTSAPECVE